MPALSIDERPDGLRRTRGAAVDIAFRVRGRGPAVVLLHGTSANHAVWEPVAGALSDRATVIALDQRGHGRSDKPASGYAGPDFAGDVLTVLDALGLERAIVGGHSLGARNAWLVAALHPERVRAVLAVDYAPGVEPEVLDELQARVAAGDRAFGSLAEIEQYLQARYPHLPADAVARRARWGYEQSGGGWRPLADPRAMEQLIEGFRTPWAREFAAVTAPMTQIRGAQSRILSPVAWEQALAARPRDRAVVDPGSDHYVPEENPALVADELGRLLDLP